MSSYLSLSLSGIGESKQGLPLGRLSVQVVSLTMPEEEMSLLGDEPFVRVRIRLEGNHADDRILD